MCRQGGKKGLGVLDGNWGVIVDVQFFQQVAGQKGEDRYVYRRYKQIYMYIENIDRYIRIQKIQIDRQIYFYIEDIDDRQIGGR